MKKQIWFVLIALVLLAGRADAVTFNSRGQVAHGVGGGAASIDNQAVACCGGGAVLVDDDTVIYQVCGDVTVNNGGCILGTLNLRNGQRATVSDRGANAVYGGGGVWVAWLGGYGTYTSTGQVFPSSAPGAVGPDGSIALKVDYYSYGPWDVLERNGSRWRLTDGDAYGVQLLGNGRAVWYEGGALHTRGLPAPQSLPGVTWWTRTTFVNGSPWIMYQSANAGGKLVVHPYTSLEGYVITQGNDTFGPDFVQLGNKLRIAYGAREGEQPGEVVVTDVDLSAPRTNLSTLIAPPPATIPPPVIVTPPTPAPAALPTLPGEVCKTLKDVRGSGPITSSAQLGDMLNRIAWAHRADGWGLNRKDAGTFCESPAGKVACDILHNKNNNLMFDVFGSAGVGEVTSPNCGESIGENANSSRPWVAPVAPDGGIDVSKPPVGTSDVVTKAQMEEAIRAAVTRLHTDLWNEVENTVGQQSQAAIDRAQQALERVEALEQKSTDDARIRAIVADIIAHAVISGKTRVAFGHQHVVDLGLTVK
jgi:hypothetical protein